MSGRSVNLTTLFLGRLRPPNRLTSTSRTYYRQQLATLPFLNQRKEKRKNVARPGMEPRTSHYESGTLPTALRGPAPILKDKRSAWSGFMCAAKRFKDCTTVLDHAEILFLTLKAPNKKCSRRHFTFFTFIFRRK